MLEIQRQGSYLAGDNRVLASVYNASAATLPTGAVVAYCTNTSSVVDQFNVSTPRTNQLDLVAGIVADAPQTSPSASGIPTLTPGFIIIHGIATTAYQALQISSVNAIGDKLVPVAGQTYLTYAAAGDGRDGLFCNASVVVSSSASYTALTSVFVRAM